ncbi:MAG: hypothetical protein FWH42_03795 [Dehalococcoidia bacterium]|nr:hypothetical protein [Dehalococcoidia bacterium]
MSSQRDTTECIHTDKIKTKESKERFLGIKRSLITEAIEFPLGTVAKPKQTLVNEIDSIDAFFVKPGKEASRKIPNTYDMYPLVIYNQKEVTGRFSFEDIWEYLLKIFLIHKGTFAKVLVLLYRLCFYHDHVYKNSKWRYAPSKQVCELIHNLDNLVLKDGFRDKFNEQEPLTIMQLLLFVDLLSWNEDVKYHATKGKPYFNNYSNSKTGRTNTILSLVSAPLLISEFIEDIVDKTKSGGIINVRLITSVIQKFTRSRGICIMSDKELQTALKPYLKG